MGHGAGGHLVASGVARRPSFRVPRLSIKRTSSTRSHSGLSAGLGTPAGRTMSRPTFRSARVRACARVARSLYLR